jgi:glycosyltransferase A (GT-A) superfamily protein (DUF2064 family)
VQAAAIAEAALVDTLGQVAITPAARRVLALDGRPGRWLPAGVDVIPQSHGDLARRLEALTHDCFTALAREPVVLIGMDTPQVTRRLLLDAEHRLHSGADAVLGPASDGGFWLIGLRSPVPGAFTDVPMSTARTGELQLRRLEALGCAVDCIGTLDDVDCFEDARRVARQHTDGAFAEAVGAVERELVTSAGAAAGVGRGPLVQSRASSR